MRKIASIVLLFVTVLTTQAQENTSLEDINKGWGTKTINNVINGSLGIMLERFDLAYVDGGSRKGDDGERSRRGGA